MTIIRIVSHTETELVVELASGKIFSTYSDKGLAEELMVDILYRDVSLEGSTLNDMETMYARSLEETGRVA